MKTAQEIIAKLPAQCWGVLKIDQSLIKITAGESGYRSVARLVAPSPEEMMRREGFKTMDDFCNHLNHQEGITKAQRKAMEWGSQFGWSHALSDPDNYDPAGVPYSERNPRPKTATV